MLKCGYQTADRRCTSVPDVQLSLAGDIKVEQSQYHHI